MDGYNEHVAEHLRITLLRLLLKSPGYRANDSVLNDAAFAVGFTLPRDRIRIELAWLAEQNLVTTEAMGHLQVATLTQRGQDAATGAASVPGVKRPSARG